MRDISSNTKALFFRVSDQRFTERLKIVYGSFLAGDSRGRFVVEDNLNESIEDFVWALFSSDPHK
jgi:hypothetical protein